MSAFEGSYVQGAALWRAANLGIPSPTLTWQQHDSPPPDPALAVDEAERELRERGLLTPHGPRDELWTLLNVFAQSDLELDLKFAPSADREVRVLVAIREDAAARWSIRAGEVRIDPFPASDAFAALVDALPETPPVRGEPLQLNTEHLRVASAAAAGAVEDVERAAIAALMDSGTAPECAREAVRMLSGARTLKGHFGAACYTRRKRKRIRGRRIVEVLDKPDGRVIRHADGEHTTIAPGSPEAIIRALARLTEETREQARGE